MYRQYIISLIINLYSMIIHIGALVYDICITYLYILWNFKDFVLCKYLQYKYYASYKHNRNKNKSIKS